MRRLKLYRDNLEVMYMIGLQKIVLDVYCSSELIK